MHINGIRKVLYSEVQYSDPVCRISLCRINLRRTSLCIINLCRMCRITIFMSLICEFLSREFPLLLPFVWRYSPLLPEPPLLLLPERRLGFFCRSIFGGTFGRLTGASEPLDRGGEIRFGGWDWDLKEYFNLNKIELKIFILHVLISYIL